MPAANRTNGIVCFISGKLGKIFFPRMNILSHSVCRSCYQCQKAQPNPSPQRGIYRSTSKGFPWEVLSIDVVGPLRPCKNFRYLLTARDLFTRWTEVIPIKDLNACTIAKSLNDQIFCRFGVPGALHFDNGMTSIV